jgi:hypothetical protein
MRAVLSRLWLHRGSLLALVFGGILLWQVIMPGFIGLADNGDFPKVTGRFCIGPGEEGVEQFTYLKPVYLRSQINCWRSAMPSSEIALARIAVNVERLAADRNKFDIRWMGATHAVGFLIAFCLWVRILSPLEGIGWIMAAGLVLLVFTDVGYVSYANSFYSDTAALLGAMSLVPASLLWMKTWPLRPGMLGLFGAASALFITSKGQHALIGIVPIGFLILVTWRCKEPKIRWLAGLMAVGLTGGVAWMLIETPMNYRQIARFDLIFAKLLPGSPTPALTAAELGLSPSDLAFTGLITYSPGSPMENPEWVRDFATRGGFGEVLRYYVRHPARMLPILSSDLIHAAGYRRPDLSNFPRQYGHPPQAVTARFGLWSQVRDWLFHRWPWHIVLWYLAILVGGAAALLWDRSPLRRAVLGALGCVVLMGVGEYCVASLLDAIETYRHLLLFHLFTDLTFILVLVYAVSPVSARSWASASAAEN